MAALPPVDEAALRALDAACESPSSAASTRTVVQLGKLPLARRKDYLYSAVYWDLGHLVRCCLQELSPDTRFADSNNATSLVVAAFAGSTRAMKVLLDGGANPRLQIADEETALWVAAASGRLPCLLMLLDAGADAMTASKGHTPLYRAVMNRHVECVRALIPFSALLHMAQDGCTALHFAVCCASEECFQLLLPLFDDVDVRTGRGVDERSSFLFKTALHLACGKGQMAMARALLDRGADRMALDNGGHTPLHVAAATGSLACVILLVGRPAKPRLSPEQVNAKEENGWSALHLAAYNGNERVCGVLIAMGASLDAKDVDGFTPLMLAQQRYPDKASLHELLSGRRTTNLPGTVCDHCSEPASKRMSVCSACEIVRYCNAACQLAAWEGHEAECKAERAKRKERTTPLQH